MASYEITTWMNKFLKKLGTDAPGDTGLTANDQLALRALIDAASTESVNLKQNADDDLTAYADAADAAARRTLIGAAPLVSPVFSGNPTITTTPATGNNSALIANTAFVQAAVAANSGTLLRTTIQGDPTEWPEFVIIDGNSLQLSETAYLNKPVWGGLLRWSAALATWEYDDVMMWDDEQLPPGTGNGAWLSIPDGGELNPQPVVSVVYLSGAFTGQLCRVGDSAPYTWYSWNGTTWNDITTV